MYICIYIYKYINIYVYIYINIYRLKFLLAVHRFFDVYTVFLAFGNYLT